MREPVNSIFDFCWSFERCRTKTTSALIYCINQLDRLSSLKSVLRGWVFESVDELSLWGCGAFEERWWGKEIFLCAFSYSLCNADSIIMIAKFCMSPLCCGTCSFSNNWSMKIYNVLLRRHVANPVVMLTSITEDRQFCTCNVWAQLVQGTSRLDFIVFLLHPLQCLSSFRNDWTM